MGLKTGTLPAQARAEGASTGPQAAPTVALNPGEALDSAGYKPRATRLLRPEEFIPEEYLLACSLVTCACGALHTQYECFLVRRHPSGADGATIRTKVEEMLMALPVSVATMRPKRIPFCGKCWERYSNMVKPHMPTTEEAWQAALRSEDARRLAAAARMRAVPPDQRIDIFEEEGLPSL